MRLPKPIINIYAFSKEVFKEFSKDSGPIVAAALSFYIFLSLIPILLLSVAVFGFLLGSPDRAQSIVLDYLAKSAPSFTADAASGIKSITHEVVRGRSAATGFGIITLLWTGISTIATLEQVINIAWNSENERGFIKKQLVSLGIFLVAGFLLGISVLLTAGINAIRNLDINIFGTTPAEWPWIWTLLGYLVPLVITIATFTMIYKILPYDVVKLRTALAGGIFAGVFWETAKYLFALYATNFANYSKVYGSLAGIILLLIWIYYSSVITMLGAEVASVKANRRWHPNHSEHTNA